MLALPVRLKQKLCLSICILLLVSCRMSPDPVSTLAVPSTSNVKSFFATDTISAVNAHLLSEIDRFSVGTDALVAIGIDPDTKTLTTVDLAGYLKQFQIGSHTFFNSRKIAPVSLKATALTSSTHEVLTAAGITSGIESPEYATNIVGAKIWDVQSGELISEVDATSLPPTKYADVSLSADGQWLAAVEGAGHHIFNAQTGKRIYQDAFSEGGTNFAALEAVTFDPSGQYLAVASGSGSVWLYNFDPSHPFSDVLKSRMRLAEPRIRDGLEVGAMVKPLDIVFDPTRKWLAVIFANEMSVYDLKSYSRHLHSTISQHGPSAQAVFDPTGSLLAIGTKSGWQLWDMKTKALLLENQEAPVYALSFSRDGRLLVYGDVNGIVHTWGISSK